jgi:hypothetical protein
MNNVMESNRTAREDLIEEDIKSIVEYPAIE